MNSDHDHLPLLPAVWLDDPWAEATEEVAPSDIDIIRCIGVEGEKRGKEKERQGQEKGQEKGQGGRYG